MADVFVSGTDGVPPPGLVERLRGLLPRIVLVLLLLGVAGAVWRWVWRWEWRWVWRWVRRRVRPRTRPPVGGVDSNDGTDAPGP